MSKNIGIWGLGIVGKSAVTYFSKKEIRVHVYDKRPLNDQELAFLASHGVTVYPQDALTQFLQEHDYILPSAGIDLRPYTEYRHKWLSELDIFAAECTKPIIAITGSVGKTTSTHLLSQLLSAHDRQVFTGGNIGVGLLDDIEAANTADYVVLEVSSFQLELCTSFAPQIALWTNFYANHLDRHGTLDDYFNAKLKIFMQQQPPCVSLAPLALRPNIISQLSHICTWFSRTPPTPQECATFTASEKIYYFHDTALHVYQNRNTTTLYQLNEIPEITYQENILMLAAIMDMMGYSLDNFTACLQQNSLPEHRLEKVATIGNVTFYNDSKSTLPISTIAALEKFKGQRIILFLGGVSKGVNRFELIEQLAGKVKYIYCFGKEAEQLTQWCEHVAIVATAHATLDDAFTAYTGMMQSPEVVLFSPSGASYDLFANYQERGNYFKKLVLQLHPFETVPTEPPQDERI